MQRYPRSARKIIWSSQASALRGQPWLKTTGDRKRTRLNSSHGYISYAVFCLKKINGHRMRPRSGRGGEPIVRIMVRPVGGIGAIPVECHIFGVRSLHYDLLVTRWPNEVHTHS